MAPDTSPTADRVCPRRCHIQSERKNTSIRQAVSNCGLVTQSPTKNKEKVGSPVTHSHARYELINAHTDYVHEGFIEWKGAIPSMHQPH